MVTYYCLLLLLTLIIDSLTISNGSGCRTIADWRGDWYQQGPLKVTITASRITSTSRKLNGVCFSRHEHRIILYNAEQSCFTCFVFTLRHRNLLQYKKSDCSKTNPPQEVCHRIAGDSRLYTLVRAPNQPVRCPFIGPYDFTYSIYDDRPTECNGRSTMLPCADESRYLVTYKKCSGKYSEDRTYNLSCLATWQSDYSYLYASRSGPTVTSEVFKDKYRCFVYRKSASDAAMQRSLDPSCLLQGGPDEGVYRLSLTKDFLNWPKSECQFPYSVLKYMNWRGMDGKMLLQIDDDMKTMRLRQRTVANGVLRNDASHPETLFSFRCISNSTDGSNKHTFLTYTTTAQCTSRYRCVRIDKNSENFIELHVGREMPDATFCTSKDFSKATTYNFIPMKTLSINCPRPGVYTQRRKGCKVTLKIGCDRADEMLIQKSCANSFHNEIRLRCMFKWKSHGHSRTHLVVSQTNDMAASCLMLDEKHRKLRIATTQRCNNEKHPLLAYPMAYRFHMPFDMCDQQQQHVIVTKRYESHFDRPQPNIHPTLDPNTAVSFVSSNHQLYILTLIVAIYVNS